MATRSLTAGEGSAAPHFTLPDGNGNPVGLDDLIALGPVVLVFLRGFA